MFFRLPAPPLFLSAFGVGADLAHLFVERTTGTAGDVLGHRSGDVVSWDLGPSAKMLGRNCSKARDFVPPRRQRRVYQQACTGSSKIVDSSHLCRARKTCNVITRKESSRLHSAISDVASREGVLHVQICCSPRPTASKKSSSSARSSFSLDEPEHKVRAPLQESH